MHYNILPQQSDMLDVDKDKEVNTENNSYVKYVEVEEIKGADGHVNKKTPCVNGQLSDKLGDNKKIEENA